MAQDPSLFPDSQQEDEDDLNRVTFTDTVVSNADWTMQSIYLQIQKGTIDLAPTFQRRGAWDELRKSRLIESILVGMPVPNISLAESKEHRGRFIVIDGKQRLLAIQEFMHGALKLKGLDLRDDLNQMTFGDFGPEDQNQFENSTLRTSLIRHWKDENFLWAAFFRLNSGSLPLSPQELRKALYGGQLMETIEDYLQQSAPFQSIFGQGLDKRMRDSELVLRFIAFDRAAPQYDGDFKRFLDSCTQYFEQNWNTAKQEANDRFHRLDLALSTTREIFGDNSFKKWIGNKYERVINRAVFDCVARYFVEPDISALAVANGAAVVQAFQDTCLNDRFRNSVERTTKSVGSTQTRLILWGEQLAGILGKKFDPANLAIF